MGYDRYELAIMVMGIPLTLWVLFGDTPPGSRLEISVAIAWFGLGSTLMLLSRARRKNSP